jgi:hypothetical protein
MRNMRLRLAAVGGIVVKIALTNHNVQSQFRQAIINLETHTCSAILSQSLLLITFFKVSLLQEN